VNGAGGDDKRKSSFVEYKIPEELAKKMKLNSIKKV